MRQVVFVVNCMTCTYAYVVPHYISFNSHQVLPLIAGTSPLAYGAALCCIAVHLSRGTATLTRPTLARCLPLTYTCSSTPVIQYCIRYLLYCIATVRVPCLSHAALPQFERFDPILLIAFIVLHSHSCHWYVALLLSCRIPSIMLCCHVLQPFSQYFVLSSCLLLSCGSAFVILF